MSDKFLPYAKQEITSADMQAVQESLSQDLITRGPRVQEFEESLAKKVDAKWAVVFTSATTALYSAFQAAQVSSYDRFITTPNSFVATPAAGMRLGAKPLFVDIDRITGNMSLEKLKEVVQQPLSRGRLVIAPVHFSGIAMDMQALDRQIVNPNCLIIEDAAHAIGSSYPDGSLVGSCSYSHMTVFSFHAIKTITCGEGGAVTTNDDEFYRKLLLLRNSGIQRDQKYLEGKAAPWYYEVQEISANFHMTEMQAALGSSQLKRLDKMSQIRRKLVVRYREQLSEISEIKLFDARHDSRTTNHLMIAQIDFEKLKTSRTEVMQTLKDKNIGTQYHYVPLYRMPAIKRLVGDIAEQFPEMESYYKQALSLPLYVGLTERDVDYICDSLKKVLFRSAR